MRGKQTVRDMVLSMAAIGVVVAGVYVFIPHDESADPVKRVDYRVEQATAQRAASYPVVAPKGLGDDWKATSVRYDGAEGEAWHLGYLDPKRQYVAVEQSTEDFAKFVDRVTHGARATKETERIGGASWTRYDGEKYDALVLRDGGATTVVLGTAEAGRLTEMATALKPAEPVPTPSS
ncbi:DUF4245 domain-containing protein [Streptomyces sp. NPDC060194]|uniref:DUF4245 domain-containing protein n=1 Tax=Streptomyces sp. NPDC060194 TaxID=3347069 RepID=UPI003668B391